MHDHFANLRGVAFFFFFGKPEKSRNLLNKVQTFDQVDLYLAIPLKVNCYR